MSDLHARLLAELDGYDGTYGASKPLAALRVAVELHAPQETYPYSTTPIGYTACTGCDAEGYEWENPRYPCSTIQAIARELGVNEGDDHRG